MAVRGPLQRIILDSTGKAGGGDQELRKDFDATLDSIPTRNLGASGHSAGTQNASSMSGATRRLLNFL